MSAAAKKKDEPHLELVELSTDREQGLSKNFDDPVLEEMIPGLVQGSSPAEPRTVMEEAVEAVKELVQEAAPLPIPDPAPGAIDLSNEFSQVSFQGESESQPVETPMPEMPAIPVEPEAEIYTGFSPDAPKASFKASSTAAAKPAPLPKVPPEDLLTDVPKDSVEEPANFVTEGSVRTVPDNSRWEMAEKLFELVLSEQAFEPLVQGCLAAIMEGLKAHAGSVLELDHEKEDFFFRASLGGATSLENLKAFRVPLTKGIVGHVAETGQPLLLRDLEQDQLQMKAISMGVGFEAKTCMAAPILVGGQAYGVIEVFNKTDGSLYDEADLHALEDAVKMLSKVLEVRFLMAELVKRVK